VLVAIDGGPDSGAVLDTAGRVARSRGTGVHVVHVRETRVFGAEVAELEDAERADDVVADALARLNGIPATAEVLEVVGQHTDAAEAVLEVAARVAPIAIVAGRPQQPAYSLTTVLTEQAPCDVVVVAAVRQPAPALT
jgi:nucleotide-binding universal stress UspA family protein